jgi:hypothetical protein
MLYIYQGAEFTEEQISQAAKNLGMSFDEYIKEYKIEIKKEEPVGKPESTTQGALVGGMTAPELSEPSSLEDIQSISIPTAKTGTTADTLKTQEELDKEKPGFVRSVANVAARGGLTAFKGFTALGENLMFIASEAYDPSKTPEERIAKRKVIGMMGGIVPGTGPSTAQYQKAIDYVSKGVKEFEDQDILSALQNGNVTDAAQMAVMGAAESAVSLAAAGGGVGAIVAYGGSIVGNKFDEELEADPDQSLTKLGINSILSGTNEMAFEMVTRKLLFGAGFLKQKGLAKEAADFLRKGFTNAALKFTGKTAGEGLSEGATEGMNILIDKWTLGKDISNKEVIHRIFEAGTIGMVMGGGVSSLSSLGPKRSLDRSMAENVLYSSQTQLELRQRADIMSRAAYDLKNAETVEEEKLYGDILAREEEAIIELKNRSNFELETLEGDDLNNYATNKDEILSLKNTLNQKDTSDKTKKDAQVRINQLEAENASIIEQSVESSYEKNLSVVQEEAKNLNVTVKEFQNDTDFLNYVESVRGKKPDSSPDGMYMRDRGEILINRARSIENRQINVAGHELLHAVLTKTMRAGGDTAQTLGDAILTELDKVLSNENFADTELYSRIMAYKYKYKKSGRIVSEELLTLFSDALAKGDVRLNESSLTKMGDKVRQVLMSAGMNRSFNNSSDVLNFIKDYNKSISKGYVDRSVKRIATEGAKGRLIGKKGVTEDLQNDIEDRLSITKQELIDRNKEILKEAGGKDAMTEEQATEFDSNVNQIKSINEAQTPQPIEGVDPKSAKMSEMAQNIYMNEYVGKSKREKMEAFYKIVEQFDPFIEKTINELYKERFDLKEQAITREGFKFDLINGTSNQPASSLYGLVNSYKPERGGALAQWVMQYLKDRGKRVLDQRLKNKATQGAASTDIIETTEFAESFEFELDVNAERIARNLELKKSLVKSVKSKVQEILIRQDLPLYYAKEFKAVLRDNFRAAFADRVKKDFPVDNRPKGTLKWTEYVNNNIDGIYETFTKEKVIASTAADLRPLLLDSNNNLKPLEKVRDQLIEYYTRPRNTITGEISPQRKTQHRTQLAGQIADALGYEAAKDILLSENDVQELFEKGQQKAANERKMAVLVLKNADIINNTIEVLNDKIRNLNILGLEARTTSGFRRFSRAILQLQKANYQNMNILEINDLIKKSLGIEYVDAHNIVMAQSNLMIYAEENKGNIDKSVLKDLYKKAYEAVNAGVKGEADIEKNYSFQEYYMSQNDSELSDDLYALSKQQVINVLREHNSLPPNYNKMKKGELMDFLANVDRVNAKATKEIFEAQRTDMDLEFNKILEERSGVAADKTFSDNEAHNSAKVPRFQFFIPSSAEDFKGLIYKFLPKGKKGDAAKKWFDENIFREYAKATYNSTIYKQTLFRDYKALKKTQGITDKYLNEKIGESGITRDQAIRLYLWERNDELPKLDLTGATQVLSSKEIDDVVKAVLSDKKLRTIADHLDLLTKRYSLDDKGYVPYYDGWIGGTISTDLINYANGARRKHYLTQWKNNVDNIFTDANKNKILKLYGKNFLSSLENSIKRQYAGKNILIPGDKETNMVNSWINGSIGTIMFFNRKSAVLQLLSTVNFVNMKDNNPWQMAKAFANRKQYSEDFKALFNSNYLVNRRDGVEIDIEADEIARAAAGKNGIRKLFNKLIKAGYIPTKFADSFAIALGGATFYRNRINTYIKEGFSEAEAQERAMLDFQENAEESQQSARPDRISKIQTSPLSRLILAFANTPMQYARIIKRSSQDLIMKRGDAKEHISKIAYYGFIQSLLFSGLQNLTDYMLFDDDIDEFEERQTIRALNSVVDGFLRGIGLYGNIAVAIKNQVLELEKALEDGTITSEEKNKLLIQTTSISPPLNSKLRKAGKVVDAFMYKQSLNEIKQKGFTYDNPAIEAGANLLSAGFNLPADRVLRTVDDVATMATENITPWQRLGLLGGWDKWTLGIEKPSLPSNRKSSRKQSTRGSARKTIVK